MPTVDPSSRRNGEVAGFALSLAFAGTTALRDVYFGGLFQRLPPLLVALTAFGLCSLVFLPVALIRDRGGLAALLRRPGRLCWINATTAIAWLSFFFALGTIEPALVQILFYGVGPLSVRWVDRLVPGAMPTALNRTERTLHLGLLASLVVAGVVVVGGWSGLGPQSAPQALVGIALAVGGGVSISISTLLCRVLNDDGLRPSTLLAMRFPGAIVLAGSLALMSPVPTVSGVTPSVFAGIVLASILLIVLPNYVNQIGVALASPVTVRAVLALGPVLVFMLQLVEGRLSSSAWTLAAALLYAVFAIAATLARRRAIAGAATVTRRPASRLRGLAVRREPGSIA